MCPSQPLILNFLSRLIQILERGEGRRERERERGGERGGGARGRETLRNRRQRSREIEIITLLRAHRQNWLHTRWITMEFLKSGQPLSFLISWRRNLVMNGSIVKTGAQSFRVLGLWFKIFSGCVGWLIWEDGGSCRRLDHFKSLRREWKMDSIVKGGIFRCCHFYYYCVNPSFFMSYYCINFVFFIILYYSGKICRIK